MASRYVSWLRAAIAALSTIAMLLRSFRSRFENSVALQTKWR